MKIKLTLDNSYFKISPLSLLVFPQQLNEEEGFVHLISRFCSDLIDVYRETVKRKKKNGGNVHISERQEQSADFIVQIEPKVQSTQHTEMPAVTKQ